MSEEPGRPQEPLHALGAAMQVVAGEGRGGGEAWVDTKNKDHVIRNGLKLEV